MFRRAFVQGLIALAALLPIPTRSLAAGEGVVDRTPRTAVISAFEPELAALLTATHEKKTQVLGGVVFTTGVLEGRPVVLFLSGVSMVNAAMTTQRALDHFRVSRIVFSGIAGGVDPRRRVGDVLVPEQWARYQESVMAREKAPGVFAPPPAGEPLTAAPFGMMFPKAVEISRSPGVIAPRAWLPVDPALLQAARRVAGEVTLKRCVRADACLAHQPTVVVGGAGVSGQAFVDNAALRGWLARGLFSRGGRYGKRRGGPCRLRQRRAVHRRGALRGAQGLAAACTSISTSMPGPTSEATWTVTRAGLLGWAAVPKCCL